VKKKKLILPLVLIVFLAAFLRLFKLADLPKILNRDEAALAYNAYLLGETGMDEWQFKFLFVFKSFGDYKLPGYIYTLLPLLKLFPFSDFMVRLPSALAGVFLVIIAYFWAKDIFRLKEKSALLFAFLIAVTPVFSFYSRVAFEANLALTLFTSSLYFLFREKRILPLSIFLMLLAVLTYNTPLLLLPFIILILPFLDGLKNYKKWGPAVVSFSILFLLIFIKLNPLTSQKSSITIFSDANVWLNYLSYRENLKGISLTLFGSKYFYFFLLILKNFFASFSPQFLVINGGDHPWHSIAGSAHLNLFVYLLFLPAFILFAYNLWHAFKKKKKLKKQFLIFYLLIISLAPSVVTVDSPHATRSLFFFFILIFLLVYVLDKVFLQEKLKKYYYLVWILFLLNAVFYQFKYFVKWPDNQSPDLWVEYKDLVKTVEKDYSRDGVAVLDGGGYQYILTAWYGEMRPDLFFKTIKFQESDQINFYYAEFLGHYHFIKDKKDHFEDEKIILSPENALEKL
jgi:4-amino-4-deoxy-L-arabinose transferase-like glycosyltransferase